MIKVCKFGGTSLATREQIEKAIDIMLADDSRRYMVVSAPGARYKGDKKVTDILVDAAISCKKPSGLEIFWSDMVMKRFSQIVPDKQTVILNAEENLQTRLASTRAKNYEDSVKAFGEYANAQVIASILNEKGVKAKFVDPKDIGFFVSRKNRIAKPDSSCYDEMGRLLKNLEKDFQILVIPGFYAYDRAGMLFTLPRGSSDTSGAVVARAVNAENYENFTDEDGLKRVNPKILPNAETIPEMTYDEARGLAYAGFKLADACFEPIKGRGIVLNVKNTNNPKHPGTRIVDSREISPEEYIAGVACEPGHIRISMGKLYSDLEVGLGRKLMQVFEDMKIPYEHHPTGVDTLAVILRERYLSGKNNLNKVLRNIEKRCKVENITTTKLSLLSVTGLGMNNHVDTHARIFSSLAKNGIYVRTTDDGADDYSFFIGVDESRGEDAVRAVYDEFFGKKNN
jgi:aspartate kinase